MTSATLAAGLAAVALPAEGGFEPPSLNDFFPTAFLLAGTPFAVNRIMMVRLIMTVFLGVRFLNISGVIPGLNIAATSVIGMPIIFAAVAYIAFFYAGIKNHGIGGFLRSAVLPSGVPKVLWILIIPIEFLSNLIMRPVTLTIRLLANMVSGHFLLALCYAATSALFFTAAGALKGLGVVTFGVALAFVLFEVFVASLQAYIFALLTAVYIESSINTH